MIHCCKKIFRGRGSHDFVLEICVFCRCYESGYSCSCSVEDLLVDCELGFAPSALGSPARTLSMSNLRGEPWGRRAVWQKTSSGWGMGVEEVAKSCVEVFWKVV